jgi:hypothetical protein
VPSLATLDNGPRPENFRFWWGDGVPSSARRPSAVSSSMSR